MDAKTHFVVTFVALAFLGVIVVKPDTLKTNKDRDCAIEYGKLNCQSRPAKIQHFIAKNMIHN